MPSWRDLGEERAKRNVRTKGYSRETLSSRTRTRETWEGGCSRRRRRARILGGDGEVRPPQSAKYTVEQIVDVLGPQFHEDIAEVTAVRSVGVARSNTGSVKEWFKECKQQASLSPCSDQSLPRSLEQRSRRSSRDSPAAEPGASSSKLWCDRVRKCCVGCLTAVLAAYVRLCPRRLVEEPPGRGGLMNSVESVRNTETEESLDELSSACSMTPTEVSIATVVAMETLIAGVTSCTVAEGVQPRPQRGENLAGRVRKVGSRLCNKPSGELNVSSFVRVLATWKSKETKNQERRKNQRVKNPAV